MNKLCEWDRLLEREKSLRDYEKEMYARITNNQKGLTTEESRIYFMGYEDGKQVLACSQSLREINDEMYKNY